MKTGSDLLRTLSINAATGVPIGTRVKNVPISLEEAEELLRLAEIIDQVERGRKLLDDPVAMANLILGVKLEPFQAKTLRALWRQSRSDDPLQKAMQFPGVPETEEIQAINLAKVLDTHSAVLVVNNDPDHHGVRTGTLNGEPVRVLGPGEHPITKEKFSYIVERTRDLAMFGVK